MPWSSEKAVDSTLRTETGIVRDEGCDRKGGIIGLTCVHIIANSASIFGWGDLE